MSSLPYLHYTTYNTYIHTQNTAKLHKKNVLRRTFVKDSVYINNFIRDSHANRLQPVIYLSMYAYAR